MHNVEVLIPHTLYFSMRQTQTTNKRETFPASLGMRAEKRHSCILAKET